MSEKKYEAQIMPSFFSPSPSHGAVISSVAFAIRSFTSVSYNTFVPFWGTVLAQHGQARYPTWASTLPHLGTFAARMLPICPQYGRLRLGFLKKTEFHLSSCCFRRTKSICPSPSGEARWGLKRLTEFSSRVSVPSLRGSDRYSWFV